MILVKQGDNMPLHVQLATGNVGKYVRAFLKDDAGVAIGSPIDLTEVGSGLYIDNSYIMPAKQFVLCIYKVYDDAGYTEISEDDGDHVDLFALDTDVSLIRKDTFIAELVANELTGLVKSDKIIGNIEGQTIEGKFVLSPRMIGEIQTTNILTGVLCKHCPS